MRRVDEYRAVLRPLGKPEWPTYLAEHSGLPGPRGNIELARAVAEEADAAYLEELIATDDEYLVFCGVVGLGRLLAEGGGGDLQQRLRVHAADDRWRVREAVAMALQRLGDSDMPRMLDLVTDWSDDSNPLVQRAAAAGVCEPRLLRTPEAVATAIEVCDRTTRSLAARPSNERRDPGVRALRKGLGYCWSVAVAADPVSGLPRFRALSEGTDADVAWIVRENSRKTRLARLL
ncbi:MAG: HEAT repeat domain-containing protein [Nocardioidaceae bacterium]